MTTFGKCPDCQHMSLERLGDQDWCGVCGYVYYYDPEPLPRPYSTSFDAVREALAPSLTRFMEDTDISLSGVDE